jgi:hypothetical protein
MIAVRTDVVVCQQAENVVSAEPTRDVDLAVQESPDVQVMVLSKVVFAI